MQKKFLRKMASGDLRVPTKDITPKKTPKQRWQNLKSSHTERYQICLQCEHLNKFWKFCNLCGCFMPLKTKLRWAECPDEPARWT